VASRWGADKAVPAARLWFHQQKYMASCPAPADAALTLVAARELPQLPNSGVGVTSLPYPSSVCWDMHVAFEIEVVLTGLLEKHYPGDSFTVSPGGVCLMPAWEPHGWRAATSGTTLLVVHFRPQFLGEELVDQVPWMSLFAAAPRDRPSATDAATAERILDICGMLQREVQEGAAGWSCAARLCVLLLLLAVGRGWSPPDKLGRPNALQRVSPAIALVYQHPERRVGRGEAAAACALSAPYFSMLFCETIGLSFGEFGLRFRLAHATELLIDTSLSVETIAERLGFANAGHLHRRFAQLYGQTPAQYRSRIGGKV